MQLHNVKHIFAATILASMMSGCIVHVSGSNDGFEISKVFGDIDVDESSSIKNVSTVNGNIDIDNHSSAKNVETVNGGIDIGDYVTVRSAETVNGDIEAGNNLTSERSLSTVNGDIEVEEDSSVGEDVETVNGDIDLNNVKVGNNVMTNNGDVTLRSGTVVEGDVIFRRSNSRWGKKRRHEPTLTIEENVKVKGRIILEKPVKLEFDNRRLEDKIERSYTDE
jgi:DUF4097 and DUF4098 domain-containing protein YvlB